MNTITLTSRARTLGTVAAAGVTALIGTLAVAGSAGAWGPNAAGTDVPRLDLQTEVWCYEGDLGSVSFYYDDLADGHVPHQVHEEVSDGSSVVWTRDDLYQEHGDYFNMEVFAVGTAPFDRNATVTYAISMTYDDGVTQTHSTSVDLSAECTGTPSTTAPATTSPSTEQPDRFGLWASGHWCGGQGTDAYLSWHYTDYPDGHYAARVDIEVLKNGAPYTNLHVAQPDPASDGNERDFELPSGYLSPEPLEVASYTMSITVTYEDGATDQHIETFNLNDLCNGVVNGRTAAPVTTTPATTTPANSGSTTTTTVPSGTLPETGSSNLTWAIGAVGGLLTTAGAALFAGVRRSRND